MVTRTRLSVTFIRTLSSSTLHPRYLPYPLSHGTVQACHRVALPYRNRDCTLQLDRTVAQEGRDKERATSNVNVIARCHREGQLQEVRVSRINIVRLLWRGQNERRDGTYINATPSQTSSRDLYKRYKMSE